MGSLLPTIQLFVAQVVGLAPLQVQLMPPQSIWVSNVTPSGQCSFIVSGALPWS
ncbi:MAG: hypothetical protein IPH76_03660 [Xanthomonadales bacterium]|nr:hypothetical protein [Xanthomonadales bacterium]